MVVNSNGAIHDGVLADNLAAIDADLIQQAPAIVTQTQHQIVSSIGEGESLVLRVVLDGGASGQDSGGQEPKRQKVSAERKLTAESFAGWEESCRNQWWLDAGKLAGQQGSYVVILQGPNWSELLRIGQMSAMEEDGRALIWQTRHRLPLGGVKSCV